MNIQRKGWRNLYKMIAEGHLTEKESYEIACAIFSVNIQYEYIPQFPIPEESSQSEEPQNNEITVKGFRNNG